MPKGCLADISCTGDGGVAIQIDDTCIKRTGDEGDAFQIDDICIRRTGDEGVAFQIDDICIRMYFCKGGVYSDWELSRDGIEIWWFPVTRQPGAGRGSPNKARDLRNAPKKALVVVTPCQGKKGVMGMD